MIDNVVNMIEGIKNKVDTELLMVNSDPLGYFPEMKNIKVIYYYYIKIQLYLIFNNRS
jgi:V-type H+-transporting ATPase subunit d